MKLALDFIIFAVVVLALLWAVAHDDGADVAAPGSSVAGGTP